MKKIIFIGSLLFVCITVRAQKGEVGIWGGGAYYIGDINPQKHLFFSKPAFGALYRYNFTTRIAVRAGLTYGKLIADDASAGWNPERELKFESHLIDASGLFEFNFLDFFVGSKRNRFTTFLFAGFSAFYFNPKADGVALRPLGTEGQNYPEVSGREPYSNISFAFPFGLGAKYSIAPKLGIAVEWGLRKTFTDYLDDVSTTYFKETDPQYEGTITNPNPSQAFYSDPTGRYSSGEQRGDSQGKDWYSLIGVSVTYKLSFFSHNKCRDIDFSPRYYNAID